MFNLDTEASLLVGFTFGRWTGKKLIAAALVLQQTQTTNSQATSYPWHTITGTATHINATVERSGFNALPFTGCIIAHGPASVRTCGTGVYRSSRRCRVIRGAGYHASRTSRETAREIPVDDGLDGIGLLKPLPERVPCDGRAQRAAM
jgi:hypothetical protein